MTGHLLLAERNRSVSAARSGQMLLLAIGLIVTCQVYAASRVQYGSDGLSVDLRDAEITTVLDLLRSEAGVDFRIDASIGGRVTERFSGLSLEEGLKRILSGYNHVLVYGSTGEPSVSRVMILGTGSDNPRLPDAAESESTETVVEILDSPDSGQKRELVLERQESGHYFARGYINGVPVDFLVDTGATTVAIPSGLAAQAGLRGGQVRYAETANGRTSVRQTQIRELTVGELKLWEVAADIVPQLNPNYALLGMSFLSAFDLDQRGDLLIIRER